MQTDVERFERLLRASPSARAKTAATTRASRTLSARATTCRPSWHAPPGPFGARVPPALRGAQRWDAAFVGQIPRTPETAPTASATLAAKRAIVTRIGLSLLP
jgi:hypothetical protein